MPYNHSPWALVALVTHHGNALPPGAPGFEKEKFVILPAYDCYETSQQHLVQTAQGRMCNAWVEEDIALSLEGIPFKARAVELRHYQGHIFHLSVKAPEDGSYLPSDGDHCHVRLDGITRVMPEVQRAVDTEVMRERIRKITLKALDATDFHAHIRSHCSELFETGQLTDEMIDGLMSPVEEDPATHDARIRSLVKSWAEQGLFSSTEAGIPTSEPSDKRVARVSFSV